MSFLKEIKAQKNKLKSTTTIVTHLDGRRFTNDENTCEIERKPFGFVVDTKPDNVPAKISENIFLGSQDCCDFSTIKKYDISHVLSVGVESPTRFPGVTHKFTPCLDLPETDLKAVIDDCVPFLSQVVQSNSKVLVHCNAGVSRSAAVVIGFLIIFFKYSYNEAFEIVKHARNCARPNSGFEKQLKSL